MRMPFDHGYMVYHYHHGWLLLLMLLALVAVVVAAVALASRNGRPAFEWALTVAAAGFLGVFLLGGPGLLLGVALAFAVLVLLPVKAPLKTGPGAFCPNCGQANVPGKPFCPSCGAAQSAAAAVPLVPPVRPEQPLSGPAGASGRPKPGRWWRLGR